MHICLLQDHVRALWIGQTAIADPKQSVSDYLHNRPHYFSDLRVTSPVPHRENLEVCLVWQCTGVSVGTSRLVFSFSNGNRSVCGQFGFKINCNEMKLLMDWWEVFKKLVNCRTSPESEVLQGRILFKLLSLTRSISGPCLLKIISLHKAGEQEMAVWEIKKTACCYKQREVQRMSSGIFFLEVKLF